ncbi:hypothetical protein ACE6H2_006757 [Prunus campanulata]
MHIVCDTHSKTPKAIVNGIEVNVTPSEEKTVDEEPLVYANKQEAKNAFKALLESANVHSDWTWKQVNSQWRKVQDRLEDDERCLHLEKLDRLLIFQDYIRDLEKEEEEQKKEQLWRVERKNCDEFRKLIEEHVADGTLTAKTHWRDYCMEVKDLSSYEAVASNTSGSTPKELFEDVAEELEKQMCNLAIV